MNSQLWEKVSQALQANPSKQPIGFSTSVNKEGENNDQKKASAKGAITAGFHPKQRGNPNRSYSVSIINKAKARIG